jgi:hypothetical protein
LAKDEDVLAGSAGVSHSAPSAATRWLPPPPGAETAAHSSSELQVEWKWCPHCAERIQKVATWCRFCGRSAKPPIHPLSIAALLANLLGVPIGTLLALVLGYRAMREIDKSQGRQGGRGLALAGVIWAWGALALVVAVLTVGVVIAMLPSPFERAKAEGDDVARSFAAAQFDYHSDHGAYTTDLSVLMQRYGANAVSRSEDVDVVVSGNSFCMAFYLQRGESSFGYPYNVVVAVWSYSPGTFELARHRGCHWFR